MAAVKLTNNATSLLAAPINASVTSLSVASGAGALYPTLGAGDWFPLTLVSATGFEIVRCTARAGDVMTVTRAQEGTLGRSFAAGDRVELRITAAAVQEIEDRITAAEAAVSLKADKASPIFSGFVYLINAAADAVFIADAAAGRFRGMYARTAGSIRWLWGADSASESGGDAGSNFAIYPYTDAGAVRPKAVAIQRSDGAVIIGNPPGGYAGAASLNAEGQIFYRGNPLVRISGADAFTGTVTAPRFITQSFTLANNAAASMAVNVNGGNSELLAISTWGGNGANLGQPRGLFACRSGDPSAWPVAMLADTKVAFTTGILSGSTGTVGNFTISQEAAGLLYFENRTGSSRTFSVTVLG